MKAASTIALAGSNPGGFASYAHPWGDAMTFILDILAILIFRSYDLDYESCLEAALLRVSGQQKQSLS
jgi:hypothetical protein